MKKYTLILGILACTLLTSVIYTSPELFESDPGNCVTVKERSTLPLLAGICDIIGIGRVTNTWANGKGVLIAVDEYWRGNPGTDTLSVFSDYTNNISVSDEPMVFFVCERWVAKTNSWYMELGYSHIFERDDLELYNVSPEMKMRFIEDDRSMFPASDTNLVNFATNLICAVDTFNTNLFYEIIRDGFNNSPTNFYPNNSRIYEDSYLTFGRCGRVFTTNFMEQVMWWDPLLQGMPRGCLINHYESKTGIWIHEVLPRP